MTDFTTFPIPTEALETLSGADLAAFQAAMAAAGIPILATVRITSAQLLAISTSPVTIVAAPGAGFKILPIAASIEYNFLASAYHGLDIPDLYYGAGTSGASMGASGVISAIDGSTSSDTITAPLKAQTAAKASCENLGLVFADDQNWTGGGGSLIVNLVYVIVPVT